MNRILNRRPENTAILKKLDLPHSAQGTKGMQAVFKDGILYISIAKHLGMQARSLSKADLVCCAIYQI